LWIVEEEEHDDSKEDNQRRNEHECEQEQTQPKGEALAGEKPAGHMFGESGEQGHWRQVEQSVD
jgi:hypothetical protein